jgi:FixJ family two-component response regulator
MHTVSRVRVISIVDDDRSGRIALSSLVRSMGYEPCLFASAEEFLASTQRNQTDCLISDVQMPGMTGLDLQDELIHDGQAIPMILITAHPEETVRRRAKDAGAVGFLSKPFDGQVMIDCIEAIFASA